MEVYVDAALGPDVAEAVVVEVAGAEVAAVVLVATEVVVEEAPALAAAE